MLKQVAVVVAELKLDIEPLRSVAASRNGDYDGGDNYYYYYYYYPPTRAVVYVRFVWIAFLLDLDCMRAAGWATLAHHAPLDTLMAIQS